MKVHLFDSAGYMPKKTELLKHMGIQTWIKREEKTTLPLPHKEFQNDLSELDWGSLSNVIKNCTACSLCQTRTKTVFGVGNPSAKLMFIGEAPGANEDLQGEPFVGRAGKLLDNMMASIGLNRHEVFIANILKCRPPQNRDPSSEEVAKCTPFLNRQIELIQPSLLVALGRIAAQYLLSTQTSLTKLRQTIHCYGESKIPLIATFHPAYLLRSPADKAKAYEDLIRIKKQLEHTNSM